MICKNRTRIKYSNIYNTLTSTDPLLEVYYMLRQLKFNYNTDRLAIAILIMSAIPSLIGNACQLELASILMLDNVNKLRLFHVFIFELKKWSFSQVRLPCVNLTHNTLLKGDFTRFALGARRQLRSRMVLRGTIINHVIFSGHYQRPSADSTANRNYVI